MDVEKDYDNFWHIGLLNKAVGITVYIFHIKGFFLKERKFAIRRADDAKENQLLEQCVLQGSVRNLLFYIITNSNLNKFEDNVCAPG